MATANTTSSPPQATGARRPGLRVLVALPGLHRVNRGAETALEAIARHLVLDAGARVTVVGSGPPRDGDPYEYRQVACLPRERFVGWPSLPYLRDHYTWEELSFAPGLVRAYAPGNFDVTLTCGYPYTSWVLRARRSSWLRRSPKHVYVTQNGDWMCHAREWEFRHFGCDALVCTNPDYFDRHRKRWPTALIPNGVDPARFCPGEEDREGFGLPRHEPVALMVSALIPSKRVIEGIRAVSRLRGVHLAVAGDGELRTEVLKTGRTLLGDRFHLLALPRERMPALYRSADVFLHMSLDEPSANAYIEALASGLPIVTHDRAVTRWTLEDQAVLVDATDDRRVANGIAQAMALRSPQDVARRRELVERRFTWSRIAITYAGFFEQLHSSLGASVRFAPAPVGLARGGMEVPSRDVGVVVIGRNEGARLRQCLESLSGRENIVYVDSDSSDGSVALARSMGASVIELSNDQPFTAARARNAGVDRLLQRAPGLRFVQFVDGDCTLAPGWIGVAAAALDAATDVAVVCGRRRERHREASVYNLLCDLEWDAPTGEVSECGGDAMVRVDAFRAVAGFDPTLIAGEEPDLCVRLRLAGWKVVRLPDEMTLHDAAMDRFGQWWRRNVRAGHAFAEGAHRHGRSSARHWVKQARSNWLWGAAIPLLAALLAWPTSGVSLLLLAAYPLQAARVYVGARRRWAGRDAAAYAAFCVLGKLPQAVGQLSYVKGTARGRRRPLIEYKRPEPYQEATYQEVASETDLALAGAPAAIPSGSPRRASGSA